MTESSRAGARPPQKKSPIWDVNRIARILTANLEEIQQQHPEFFGSLSIEVSFRDGVIETVAVERRQTLKN